MGNRASGHVTRDEARQERWQGYRRDVARYGYTQMAAGVTAWRECGECSEHTPTTITESNGWERWVCQKCGHNRSWRTG